MNEAGLETIFKHLSIEKLVELYGDHLSEEEKRIVIKNNHIWENKSKFRRRPARRKQTTSTST